MIMDIQSQIDAAYAAGEPLDLGPDDQQGLSPDVTPIVDCRGGTIQEKGGRLIYWPPNTHVRV